jgi:hypothetical protein
MRRVDHGAWSGEPAPARTLSRRRLLRGAIAAASAVAIGRDRARAVQSAPAPAEGAALAVVPAGPERDLPDRLFGFNSVVTYDVPHEDPAMVPVLAWTEPHYLRFPGGTVANYFDWRTGKLRVPDVAEGASVYRRFLLEQAQPMSHRLHPDGITIERFAGIAREVGAEVIVVPNLETSTPEEQAAWFAHMRERGVAPRMIEMGNEFYLALLMDRETLRIFPDWRATVERTRSHLDAIRPFLPEGAKVAVQAPATRLHELEEPATPRGRREWQWDRDLRPEPWFHAVTIHLYPTIEGSAGAGSLRGLPGNLDRVYPAVIARADEGIDRALRHLEERMPGKEIWITEWGAFEPAATFAGARVRFDGLWFHLVARGMLAFLRRPAVTVATYHASFFSGNLMSTFRRVAGRERYAPINAAGLLRWFHGATRGPGVVYRPVAIEGSRRIEAAGTVPGEGFAEVAAALFRRDGASTLLVHNAGREPRRLDVSSVGGGAAPASVETMATPDLAMVLEEALLPARVLEPAPEIELPPYSVTRVAWG